MWSTKIFGGYGGISPNFAQEHGRIYVTTSDYIYGQGHLICLNASTGEVIWDLDSSPSRDETGPTIHDGVVYFGTLDSKIYAVNASDGEIIWVFNATSAIRSTPTGHEGYLFVGSEDGTLYAMDASSRGPEASLFWNFSSNGAIKSTPMVGGETLFISTGEGTVYAIDVSTFAKAHDGGGHFRAAGLSYTGDLAVLQEEIIAFFNEQEVN